MEKIDCPHDDRFKKSPKSAPAVGKGKRIAGFKGSGKFLLKATDRIGMMLEDLLEFFPTKIGFKPWNQ